MDGDTRIVFTASTGWIGRLIRWVTRSKVSHVAIEYSSSTWGGQWIAEADWRGVWKVPAAKVKKNVYCEYKCKFDARPALQSIAGYVGTTYDYKGLFMLAWITAFWRIFRIKIRKPLWKTNSVKCSELVAKMLIAADPSNLVLQGWDPEMISPEDVRLFCEAEGARFVLVE